MSTKEILLDKINHIEDEALLNDILEIIDLEIDLNQETVVLTENQKKVINEGLKDIEEGRVFSDKEAKDMIGEWLKKKK